MKKTVYYGIMMMLSAGALCSSCSDDDNEGNANGNAPSTPLTSQAKVLLTQLDDEYFEYDEKFRPVAAMNYDDYDDEWQEEWRINYGKGTISLYDGECPDVTCTINAKGYITKISGTVSYIDEDNAQFSETYTGSFEYDGDNHLISLQYTGDAKITEGSNVEYDHYVSIEKYTWDNGNLVEAKVTDQSDNDTYEYTTEFTYGEQENKYRQYPGSWTYYDTHTMYAVGLCGIGPKNLPTSQRTRYNSYDEELFAEYTLNEDGTIKQEIWKNASGRVDENILFTYTPMDQYVPSSPKLLSTRSATAARLSGREKAESLKRFFRSFSLVRNMKFSQE